MDQQSKVSRNCGKGEKEGELRRGPWTVEEDLALIDYIAHHGHGRWNSLASCAGLRRTGKSCRLRWLNYLRPEIRRGNITLKEELLILELHSRWGNRWSKIAQHLPGRTDNEIKNYWRTRVQKQAKLLKYDVNSQKFRDTMRHLWMPRLVERIQSATGTGGGTANTSSSTTTFEYPLTSQNTSVEVDEYVISLPSAPTVAGGGLKMYTPEPSSAAASSDSFATQVSDMEQRCKYLLSDEGNYNQDYSTDHYHFCNGGDQSLTSPVGYFNQPGFDFPGVDQNNQWMDGRDGVNQNNEWMGDRDVVDSFWNGDDLWFLQEQLNGNV